MQIDSPRISRCVFYILLISGSILGLSFWVADQLETSLLELIPSDRAHTDVGLYCPGCGGTRSFIAFFEGKFWESFYYHPAIMLLLLALILFMLSHVLEIISRGRISAIRLKPMYFYIFIALLLLQWLGKYVYMWVTGIKPI